MPGRTDCRLSKLIARYAANVCGGLALTFAMSAPVLIGSLGVAIDFVNYNRVKTDLQAAADAAAVAGAREMQLAQSDSEQVTSAALSFAAHRLTGNADATAEDLKSDNLMVHAEILVADSAVKVDIAETWSPFFAHFVSTGITPVTVSATARFVGSNNICVLGLSNTGRAVYLDRNSRLTGNDCGIYSNSSRSDGFKVDAGAHLSSSLNCVKGGKDVDVSAVVDPGVLTDCPAIADPLSNRPPPAVGACDFNKFVVKDETRSLSPGVYCGGLVVDGKANVTAKPGIYILKDGELKVAGEATLSGEGVSFFITGKKPAPIYFAPKSHLSLSAPADGAMAGLLFYEDRGVPQKLKHKISSDDARKLEGTIYLPVGDLIIDAKDPVADQSAYTAIIVNKLELNMGPNLILNSDYDATDVPVPEGIKGASQVVLTE
jgi:Flp pilus assembly protein TadG